MATTIADVLEEYRGQRTKLKREMGAEGMRWLHAHPEVCGSPTAACEFLGMSMESRSNFSKDWTCLQLPVQKRDAVQGEQQKWVGMTPADRISYYEKLTSEPEWAPVCRWGLPRKAEYGICVIFSDLHYQHPHCDVTRFRKLLLWLYENPTARWMFLGDMFETKCNNSPGKDEVIMPIEQAKEDLCYLLEPVAKQGIVILSGNHDVRPSRAAGIKVTAAVEEVAKAIGVYFGGHNKHQRIITECGKVSQQYDGYVTHGTTGAQTAGGRRNAIHKIMANLDADFAAMGHVHDKDTSELLRSGLSEEMVVQSDGREYARVIFNEKTMGIAGSFLKHMAGGYAREGDMAPASLGNISFHFYTGKKNIHAWK